MARWWLRFGSECRGLSDVGQLRFSNGSDLCGMMLHDVSCGSELNAASGSACLAQVYMVQLWFRVGVTSMWFRCVSVFSSSLSVVQLVVA